jgi:hypothetical protein
MLHLRHAVRRGVAAIHGEGVVVRLILVLALVGVVVGGARFVQSLASLREEADAPVVQAQAPAGGARIERDRTSRCIPADPAHEAQCDRLREAFWQNHGNAIAELLRLRRVEDPATADIIAAGIQLRADAGDLQTLAMLATKLQRDEVRVVAVAPAPADPRHEYVELQNIGGIARDLTGLALLRPTSGGFLPSSQFRLKGSLLPGQTCRVYTWPAGQDDACAGRWTDPILLSLWPRTGGVVVLQEAAGDQPTRIVDRWNYRAPEQG